MKCKELRFHQIFFFPTLAVTLTDRHLQQHLILASQLKYQQDAVFSHFGDIGFLQKWRKTVIIIIIYFQFYYITAIAALNEGAHGVFRNVANLVNNIRLILIIFWVSSPSKSSYCGTFVTIAPSLSVGQWRRCSWVSSESSHLRHWVVFSPTLKLLLTSSILDRAANVNCFSLIDKSLWLDCRYDWSFSSLCLTLLDFEWEWVNE